MQNPDLLLHVQNILQKNMLMKPEQQLMMIYDTESILARMLFEAYQEAGKTLAQKVFFMNFYENPPEKVIESVKNLKRGDIVVLIQSTSFRMSNFRWRLELFNLGLGVVEHAHLGVNQDEEAQNYVDILEYQGDFYQKTGRALKAKIDQCQKITVECNGTILTYDTQMEEAKLNIGDYSDKPNKGSAFPIGEVFSEPKNLQAVNGEVMIYAFANKDHRVVFTEPFKTIIREGAMSAPEAPPEFQEVLALIQTENPDGKVMVREFGLGMNKGVNKNKRLTDISAYERVKGLHISLGMKHDIYRDKIEKNKTQRFHIDIFPDVQKITIDDMVVFENGEYLV